MIARLLFLAITLLAATAQAAAGGHAEPKTWAVGETFVLFDETCTDDFDIPVVSNGRDALDEAQWDTFGEAMDVVMNIGDPQQTSGSSDGWCDEAPWTIQGDIALGSVLRSYYGPFWLTGPGVIWSVNMANIGTSYALKLGTNTEWSSTSQNVYFHGPTVSTTGETIFYYGPGPTATNTELVGQQYIGPVPMTASYFELRTDGAATWRIGIEMLHVAPR
ncbi:MAG: hypothetical protein V3S01_09315 [Dehalococcoidia bacterium]